MRARLVGDDVGVEAHVEELRHDIGRVAEHADRHRATSGLRVVASIHRVVERGRHLVQVAGLEPALDAVAVDLDAQRDPVVHRDRERLRAAHAAEPGGQRDGAAQRSPEPPARDLGEALVRPWRIPCVPM